MIDIDFKEYSWEARGHSFSPENRNYMDDIVLIPNMILMPHLNTKTLGI
jgi:hypothetical protein